MKWLSRLEAAKFVTGNQKNRDALKAFNRYMESHWLLNRLQSRDPGFADKIKKADEFLDVFCEDLRKDYEPYKSFNKSAAQPKGKKNKKSS